ncbi:MAG: FkbM family methyltransferase [Candidatus Omnitrophica bacterium]|nr:FkbM family methyltransferase [Candidatus Omnitrophota bacterium]
MAISIVRRAHKAGRLLICDPGHFCQKVYSLVRSLYPLSKYPVRKKVSGVTFEFNFSYDPVIKHMYCGEYEEETVAVMRKFLHKGDTFVDIGANIGYLSTVAAGIVGVTGRVYSFEPVPGHFARLKNIAALNQEYNITVNQCALGAEDGSAKIAVTNLANIGWNTIVPGFMSQDTIKESIDVPVSRFDNFVSKYSLTNISLIKIDTEGYEFPVLKGFSGFFEKTKDRPVILCEVAPEAYPYLGYTVDQLFDYMRRYGYEAFHIFDVSARVNPALLRTTTNVVFIPNRGTHEAQWSRAK